jgi:hypothetical protein
MAPKRSRKKANISQSKTTQRPWTTKAPIKENPKNRSTSQGSQETGHQSPARVIFDVHGVDLEREQEPASRKATCAKLDLIWTTGKPPTTAKNATILLERKLADYYNHQEQEEKERRECESQGLSTEGDGVTLRKRRFEVEAHEIQPQRSGKRHRESVERSDADQISEFAKNEILSLLKRRKLNEKGTDCERRLRLLEFDLDFLRKNCRKEWDSLFFGYESLQDLQGEAKRKRDAQPKPRKRNSVPHAEWDLIAQDILDVTTNLGEWRGRFRQENVVGDGNCMFRSFAAAYWGNENQHPKVRRDVQELWKAATQDGLGRPAPDYRRIVYQRLHEQSNETGRQTLHNAPLATQIANTRYWASLEMLRKSK